MKTHTKLVSSVAALAGLSSGVVAAWTNLGILESASSRQSTLPAGSQGTRVDTVARAVESLTATLRSEMPKVSSVSAPNTSTTATPIVDALQAAPAEVLGLQFAKALNGDVSLVSLAPKVVSQPTAPTFVAASVEDPPMTTTTTMPPVETTTSTNPPAPVPPTVAAVPAAPVDESHEHHGKKDHGSTTDDDDKKSHDGEVESND